MSTTTTVGLTKTPLLPSPKTTNANLDLIDSMVLTTAPSTATSTGRKGQIAFDATHIYVCISTNVWCRAAIATF